ncbi:MAG: hypothetical protein Q9214_006760, partial [Letrouitia sp. 1 TL-2023]
DRDVNNSNSFDWAAFANNSTNFSILQKTFHGLQDYSSLEIENVWSEILRRICSCSKENIKSAACMFRMLSVAVAPMNSETLIEFSSLRSLNHLQFLRGCPAVLELLCTSDYSFHYGLSLHPSLLMFLRSDRIKQDSLRPFYINLEEAQQEIAEKCVADLIQAERDWGSSKFSDYSGKYWHVHAAKMPPYGSAKLDRTFQQRCIQLLDLRIPIVRYWTRFMPRNRSDFGHKEDYPPPLYYATLLDLYECARMLLDEGAAEPAANHPAADYYCPFLAAVENGKDKFVSLFIKYDVDANTIVDGYSPLFRAAKNGHSRVTKALLANHADLEFKNGHQHAEQNYTEQNYTKQNYTKQKYAEQEYTALHGACINHHYRVIKLLLDAGADVEARDHYENTPLLLAVRHGLLNCAKLLIDAGANVEARDNDENTSLLLAVRHGRLECAKLLIDTEVNIEAKNKDGNTPLLLAVNHARLDFAKLLIDTGADVEARGNSGNTPLLLAALNGYLRFAKLLLDTGVHTEARDNRGRTPLLLAVFNGDLRCAQLLIDTGVHTEARDNDGSNPLLLAVYNGHLECAELLINTGADIKVRDDDGRTSLLLAVYNGHLRCAQLLIDTGADIEARDKAGNTPLLLAIHNDRIE